MRGERLAVPLELHLAYIWILLHPSPLRVCIYCIYMYLTYSSHLFLYYTTQVQRATLKASSHHHWCSRVQYASHSARSFQRTHRSVCKAKAISRINLHCILLYDILAIFNVYIYRYVYKGDCYSPLYLHHPRTILYINNYILICVAIRFVSRCISEKCIRSLRGALNERYRCSIIRT